MAELTDARFDAADALRALANAFHARDVDDATLQRVAASARDLTAALDQRPRRERVIPAFSEFGSAVAESDPDGPRPQGMADRAVVGQANPFSVTVQTEVQDDVAVARVTFGAAFEGAPGRVHGGMVAAVLDDLAGYALAFEGEPGFTGTLEVVYRAPVPIEEEIEFRTWVRARDGRKLYVEAEARLDERVLATAKLTMILVDHEHFRTHASDLLAGGAASGA